MTLGNGAALGAKLQPKLGFSGKMNLWDQILARVETKVNRHSFYTWFKPTSFVSEDTGAITVRVPSALFKDWLTKHYSGVISEAMGEIEEASLAINFIPDAQVDAVAIPLSPDEVGGGRSSRLRSLSRGRVRPG